MKPSVGYSNTAQSNRRTALVVAGALVAFTMLGTYWALTRSDRLAQSQAGHEVLENSVPVPALSGSPEQTLSSEGLGNGSSADDLDLPALEVSPEVYSQLSENPFRCSGASARTGGCNWRSDPEIARSPAEARWMRVNGYPTTDEREWAQNRSAEAVLAEARRTGSPALWALGLSRKTREAETADEADMHARALYRVAQQGASLYALEQSALASFHVADLILAESGQPSVRTARTGVVEAKLNGALSKVAMAAALGDPGAMIRVLQKAPVDLPEVYGQPLNAVTPAYAAEMIQDAYVELRRNQALAARGKMESRRFTVADISPRPLPVMQRRRTGEEVWTGEP